MGRRLTILTAAGAALLTSACSSDPAFWDSVNAGLNQLNDELAREAENCYWSTPPGLTVGQQKYCPGDPGYRDFYIPPSSPYWQGRRDHDRRDRDRDRGGHRHGDGHGGKRD